jgi:hypothetical protein
MTIPPNKSHKFLRTAHHLLLQLQRSDKSLTQVPLTVSRPVSETLTWHIIWQQGFDMSVAESEIGTTVMAGGWVVAFWQMVTVIGAAVSCFLFGEQDDVRRLLNCSER